MKVCHLGKYYPPARGGMESHVQTLAQGQAKQGWQVEVMCLNHEAGTKHEPDGPISVTRLARMCSIAKLDWCAGLTRHLRQLQADILHVHVPNPTMILGLLSAWPDIPVVVTYHSDHVSQRVLGRLFRLVEHRFYPKVKAILATNPVYGGGSWLLTHYHERVQVVPLGMELNGYLQPSAEVLQQAERLREQYAGPLWLCCGRFVGYKALHLAIAALVDVPGTLWMVGRGPLQQDLERQAEKLGVRSRVEFLNGVQDVTPYYQAATALWLPSNARSEAFGLVQVEAMASGCPVINAEIPHSGVPWVSRHEESGLTIPLNDSASLAQSARRLLSDPELRQRLGRDGRERARREFSADTMVQRILDVYAGVLKN